MSENIQVPKGWEVKKLGEVFKESRILGSKGDKAKKITLKLWGKGVVEKKEYIEGSATTQYYIRKEGQFIYSKLDFLNQAFAIIPKEYDGYETTIDLPCFDIDTSINPIFILEYIKQPSIYINYGKLFANGGRKARRVQVADFLNMPIPVPPLEEQKKIAEILSLWDKAIEQTKELIAYKEKQKKGLMQALLTGKKRLNGFTDEWKITKLGEIAYTYGGLTNKTKNDFATNGSRYISYLDIYQNYYLNKPTNNYVTITENEIQTELKHGDILFTLSSETPEEVGISCVILFEPKEKIYLNSFSFCLRLKETNILHPLFSAYIFRAEHLRQSINKLAQGATRYNLSKTNFLKLNINIPTSLAEQEAIANILSNADEEIELLNKQLELYTEQKKGLMQNLLTGKVRV